MATIDVGSGATDILSSFPKGYTLVDFVNPANDTGTLDTFEIWAATGMTDAVVGTFSGSGTTYNDRDYESIGSVTSGSKQTFTGKNCDVASGDFLGIYADTSSRLELDADGYSGINIYAGDAFGQGDISYTGISGDAISIYATGATVAAGNPYYYYLNQ